MIAPPSSLLLHSGGRASAHFYVRHTQEGEIEMNTRPTSVTVIAWFLLIIGVISAVLTVAMIDNPIVIDLMKKSPLPVSLQYAIAIAGLLVMMVSGAAMLKGRNWARLLYVIWSALGLLIGLATSPVKASLFPGLVFLAIVTFFLFRPKANNFFSQTKPSDNAQPI